MCQEYEDDDGYPPAMVIDNGSCALRVGFAGDPLPSHFIEESTSITKGIITAWDKIESVYQTLFESTLNVDMSEQLILFTESILNPKANKEKLAEIMFEKFKIVGMYIGQQTVLSLYASGRTTGVAIDSGYQQTQIVPIYEGYALSHAWYKANYGGKQCTDYLGKLLNNNSNAYVSSLKEKHCYIATNFVAECKKPVANSYLIDAYFRNIDSKYARYTSVDIENLCKRYCGDLSDFLCVTKKYELPDGNIIEIRDEQFKCPEIIFNPELMDINEQSLHELVYGAIMKSDKDITSDLFRNVVLSGGNTMFCGIEERLSNEMQCLHKATIIANKNRKYFAWIGGSILSALSTFERMWIILDEYLECGPGIINPRSGF